MPTATRTKTGAETALEKLLAYCRHQGWRGWDPYDGLNSPVLRALTFDSKFLRTAFTQLVKRSPFNPRPLLGVKKDFNPKGVALFARALALEAGRRRVALPAEISDAAEPGSEADDAAARLRADFTFLIATLERLRSAGYEEACWGYNFDWQSRAFFAPRGTPNVVCTTFAAHAFLDWHEETGNRGGLAVAESSCRFLLDRLPRTTDGEDSCFSYTPLDRSRVHNVNMLAAELLARVWRLTGNEEYRRAAEGAARYTLARQGEAGEWVYGESSSQRWIDGFHTGYVLVSLKRVMEDVGRPEWRAALARGYEFYRRAFFLADFTPGYYHDRLYPVDVHAAAQAVITFTEMTGLMPDAETAADQATRWAIDNLQDRAGYFYFQRHLLYTIRIPYIRWAQAWMLYALSFYLRRMPEGEHV